MGDKEITQQELEAIRDKMLTCLNGLLWYEACEVALNVFGSVMIDNDIGIEDAIGSVGDYYSANGDKDEARADH